MHTPEYKLCEEIGAGRFGTIYRCIDITTNELYACKIINKTVLTDSTDRECLQNEPKYMTLLSPHPNILQIHHFTQNDTVLTIVMDLCQTLTLFDKIFVETSLSEPQSASIMLHLMSALNHCHNLGVAHRDIKPDNILFDSMGMLKLSDFGSAEWFSEEKKMNGIVGTPYYVAPEILMGKEYNEKVDVWSCGVILYIMLVGIPPFYGDDAVQIFEAVVKGNLRFPSTLFRSLSSSVKELLRKMICKDASTRFSAQKVLMHPWILSGGETG